MNPRIATMFAEALKPADRRPPWQWCEEHITSIDYSPIPGRFRSSNSPWIREVMEAIVNRRVKLVSIIAPVQSTKTLGAELSLCYIIKNAPGPTLWLAQTDDNAKDHSESRLQKLFDACKPVRELYPRNRHHKRNSTIHFANGMTLWMLGAHNMDNLQSRTIRWIFGDETWLWEKGRMAEAEARVTAFGWLGKCVFMSQGGHEGDDTHTKFETTDMREWMFACPTCGARQPFLWENVEWSKDAKREDGSYDFRKVRATTALKCPHCGEYHADSDGMRRRLNETGQFVAQNKEASHESVGFHWNALATMSLGQLAEMYLRAKHAKRKGDNEPLKKFYQKRLALPHKEFDEEFNVEIASSSYAIGDENWSKSCAIDSTRKLVTAPFGDGVFIPLIFLTADVQLDHFFTVVRMWAADGSSRLLWCERVTTWSDIEGIQERFKIHSNLVFIDAGWDTFEVYRQCSERGWIALMGDGRATFTHRLKGGKKIERFYSPVRKVNPQNQKICKMRLFSNLNMKDILARLRRNQDSSRGATWEIPQNVPDVYKAHLESEHRVQEKGKWLWKQIGSRPNHFFDCEVMQVVAAVMLRIIGRESAVNDDSQEDAESE